jgi:hypothetical protein
MNCRLRSQLSQHRVWRGITDPAHAFVEPGLRILDALGQLVGGGRFGHVTPPMHVEQRHKPNICSNLANVRWAVNHPLSAQLLLSGLKVRGDISHQMANNGEFAPDRTVI